LDDKLRIVGGTVDIGAYEFQSPISIISYAWLQQYNLPTDGSADFADLDGDGLNNLQEWRCGTDPTNPISALRLLVPVRGATNVTVTWQSVAGVNYFLERSTSLAAPSAFTLVATNIDGQPGMTTYIDRNAVWGRVVVLPLGSQQSVRAGYFSLNRRLCGFRFELWQSAEWSTRKAVARVICAPSPASMWSSYARCAVGFCVGNGGKC
jgi:hypothetical protein